MGYQVGTGRGLVLVLLCSGLVGAQTAPESPWQASVRVRGEAQKLADSGQTTQAIAVLEGYLKQYPDAGGSTSTVVDRIRALLHGVEPAARHQHFERVLTEFKDCPPYRLAAAHEVGLDYLWARNGCERNPQKTIDICAACITELGKRLPPDSWTSTAMYGLQAQALLRLGKPDEAKAQLEAAVALSPMAVGQNPFLIALSDYYKTSGDTAGLVSAAKLNYVLCEYKEEALQAALNQATQALIAQGGPGLGMKLAKAQDDLTVENPLSDVPLPPFGNPDLMVAAATGNPEAELVALLYAGDFAAALEVAKEQMALAVGKPQAELAKAMPNIARVIKAHDLNLVRANQFLNYHATGDGEDPLPAIEASFKRDAP